MKEEGRRKKDEGRGKKEEGRGTRAIKQYGLLKVVIARNEAIAVFIFYTFYRQEIYWFVVNTFCLDTS